MNSHHQQPMESPKAPMHPRIGESLAYIEAHLDQRLSLVELASRVRLSVCQFSTLFRRHTGKSPRRYICEQRVQRVQALLSNGVLPADAALVAGFYDQSHLSRHFKTTCGITPGRYLAHRAEQGVARTQYDVRP